MGRSIISLNQNWLYNENFKDEYILNAHDNDGFESITLPHMNKEIPYNYFDEKMYQFISCYKKIFSVPKEHENKQIYIDFEGVMTYAEVYINGHYLGEHKGGYTPFSFNLTKYIQFGQENCLTVKVDSRERNDIPPFGFVIDYLTYGGIYREVSLRVVDSIHIDNIFAKPQQVLEDRKGLGVDVYLKHTSENPKKVLVKTTLTNKEGQKYGEAINEVEINGSEMKESLSLSDLEGIQLWDIDTPHLYDVRVEILENDQVIDCHETRVGFRSAEFTSKGFYLNGRRVKIRGLNRHQAFPYVGYAMPKRAQEKDAEILKNELHLNLVRTSHYPQSVHFLNRCDEIGLLVFEEIPGWQHIGDEAWKKVACDNVREMIERDWNHPSIILWGVRINESKDDHDFYVESNKIAHELDPTRQTGGVRCIRDSELLEDVYTMNDFIHGDQERALRPQQEVTGIKEDVPYMVTEYNGHMYPTKRFDQEERINEHVLRHVRVQNRAALDQSISGAIGWCAFDYNTHYEFGSGDRICYHGIMDMFRIPKFAAHVYSSQVSPEIEPILEPVTLWARGERDRCGVLPMTVLTNCDRIEVYHLGQKVGEYTPDRETYRGLEYPPVVIDELEVKQDWGSSWNDLLLLGYVGDKEVIRKEYAKNPIATELIAEVDDTELNSGDMDVTRILFKMVDQKGNIIPYINEILSLDIEGMGKIIGPKEMALIGGCIGVWIKTTGEVGTIKVKARCSRFEANEIKVDVR
ncbi:glycoside hydrolase family 2 protein [Vallitalea okinawensis]|uniref:glycoside hydrolase family 2 protein n=1 Tax=Vallitalea okinawensis TaxID=2078660 RepID=UPI000CFCA052|nr:glycoside hydrolase family 2 TIM barrel-domain containing protein [Vallitalea okinawensis]